MKKILALLILCLTFVSSTYAANVNVQINTTLTTISAPGMEQMFELCRMLGVKNFSVSK